LPSARELDNKRLLTTQGAADYLGVTPETVLRWVETRGLPARRMTSRAIRYDPDELDAWTRRTRPTEKR